MHFNKFRYGFNRATGRTIPMVLVLLLTAPLPAMAAMALPSPAAATDGRTSDVLSVRSNASDRFCPNSDCAKTRETFRRLCDWIVKNRSTYPTIYIGGYYMRDLVAGYEIFGDRKYLNTAIAYGDYLLGNL